MYHVAKENPLIVIHFFMIILSSTSTTSHGHVNSNNRPVELDLITLFNSPSEFMHRSGTHTHPYLQDSHRANCWSGTHTFLPTRLAQVASQGPTHTFLPTRLEQGKVAGQGHTHTHTHTNIPAYKTHTGQSRQSGTHTHMRNDKSTLPGRGL